MYTDGREFDNIREAQYVLIYATAYFEFPKDISHSSVALKYTKRV